MMCFNCFREATISADPSRHVWSPFPYYHDNPKDKGTAQFFCSKECLKEYQDLGYASLAEFDRNASDSECFEHLEWIKTFEKGRKGRCKVTGKEYVVYPLWPGDNSGQPKECLEHFKLRKKYQDTIDDFSKLCQYLSKAVDEENLSVIQSYFEDERPRHLRYMAFSIFRRAIQKNKVIVLEYLFKQKFASYLVQFNDINLNKALVVAISVKNVELAKLLIELGANNFDQAIEYAVYHSQELTDLIKLLIEKGAKNLNDTLVTLSSHSNLDLIKCLVEHGADSYNSALKMAAYNGNIQIVQYLVEKGANNIQEAFKIALAWKKDKELLEFLQKG